VFKRVHETGTEALLSQHPDGWRIQINLREPDHTVAGLKAPSVELARELADKEILKHGHRCNGFCKGWEEF
jgi:hypothetical protein